MRRAMLLLGVVLLVSATACGGGGGTALDSRVQAAVVAQNQGREIVSSVSCNDVAPPPSPLPGGGAVHAEHTCTVAFNDGQATQVWAVHVLDLIARKQAQLLYRVDRNSDGSGPPPEADLARSYSAQLTVLRGAPVSAGRCKPATPPSPPSAAALPPADHVCVARVLGQGRQRFAVHTIGSNVLLLFQLG